MYSFRIRAKVPLRHSIEIDTPIWNLKLPGKSYQVVFNSSDKETPIKNAKEIIISADGFTTAEEATIEGKKLQDELALAFAHVRFPVEFDFDNRLQKGELTIAGSELLEEKFAGKRFFNNSYGLMVFQTEPSPVFVSFSASISIPIKPEQLESTIHKAIEKSAKLSARNRTAYDLFSASFFTTTPDTRFLLLMMAVETYIELESRSNEIIKHVDFLISKTDKSNITDREKDSLRGHLQHLKKESFRQAGRRVANTLPKEEYKSMNSTRFFNYCYDIRSKLVHGYVPRPSSSEVDSAASALELFVSDLLSMPLYN